MSYAMHLGLKEEVESPYRRRTGHCHRLPGPSLLEATGDSQPAHSVLQKEDLDEAVDEADQAAAQIYEDFAALRFLHEHQDLSSVGARTAASDSLGLESGLRGWQRLPVNRYEPLLRAVYERGPVGVSVAARSWHLYSAGVFDYCDQDAVIDHAVTLIGFGRDPNLSIKSRRKSKERSATRKRNRNSLLFFNIQYSFSLVYFNNIVPQASLSVPDTQDADHFR
ncbi:unnamed protein product [Durusdinium trenchii]|uniref:Peptidase C1A papain C-terminal domain-containing protein n=1 Tax=Durusdinium trenchii TaxID=1381693 RepID=A0ABP0RXT0_9DINO